LPTQIHPLLLPKEEAEPTDDDQAVAETTPEPESDALETPESEEAPAEETAEDHWVRLDGRNLYQEFARLERENPDAANVLNTLVGRKASRKFDPKIRQLEEELEELRSRNRNLEIRSMKPEDIERRFREDPQFAEAYTRTVHEKPVDPQSKNLEREILSEIDDAIDRAERDGLSPTRVDEYRQAIQFCPVHNTNQHGFFDHEFSPDTKEWKPVSSPIRAMKLFSQSIAGEAARAKAPAPQAAAPQPVAEAPKPVSEAKKPKPNARLADAAPDLSPSSGGGGSKTRMSVSEYQQMTPPERQKLFPTMKDYEDARRSGIIHD
jgi:hypothetical protein